MAKQYLDKNGLLYFWQKIKSIFATKAEIPTKTSQLTNDSNLVVDANYVHTDNNFTTTLKDKLDGIASGAQVNKLESVKRNGTALTITGKSVDIAVPTKTSEITNDSGFITIADVPEGAAASSTTPKMDGTANVGKETAFARGDHVHPSDTSRVPTTRKVNGHALSSDVTLTASDVKALPDTTAIPQAATTSPAMDGTAAVGTATKWARADHVHPHDTTKVDKIEGKGLSTNDFTDDAEAKLSGIEAGAQKNIITSAHRSDDGNTFTLGYTNAGTSSAQGLPTIGYIQDMAGVINSTYIRDVSIDGTSIVTVTDDGKEVFLPTATASDTGLMSAAAMSKLDGIAEGATNVTIDSTLSASSSNPVQNKAIHAALGGKINTSAIGAASGVCPLNANKKIDATYLPSYVDDVVEAYARSGATPLSSAWLSLTSGGAALTPESGKIYVLMADAGDYAANTQFRWSGSAYVKLADGGVSAITNEEIDEILAA